MGITWYETDAAMEGDPLIEAMSYNAAMAAEAASDQEAAPSSTPSPTRCFRLSSLLGETADPLYEDGFDGETDTLGERDEFLPALIPFAAPLIGRGIKALGSLLCSNPRTRSPANVLPTVAAETAYDMRSLGRRPTSRDVAAAMARRTTRVLGNPTALPQTMRQNRVIAARAQARPPHVHGNRADRMGTMGTAGAAPGNRAGMRRYGIFYAPPARDSRTGRRVVGYMLRPIYASSRGRYERFPSADRCTEKGVGSPHGRCQPDRPGGSRIRILDRGSQGARHCWHPGPGPQRRAAIRRERGRLRSGPGAEHPAARGGTAPVPGRRVRHGPGQPDRGPHPRGESAAGTPATAIAGPRRRDRSLRSGCRGAIDQPTTCSPPCCGTRIAPGWPSSTSSASGPFTSSCSGSGSPASAHCCWPPIASPSTAIR